MRTLFPENMTIHSKSLNTGHIQIQVIITILFIIVEIRKTHILKIKRLTILWCSNKMEYHSEIKLDFFKEYFLTWNRFIIYFKGRRNILFLLPHSTRKCWGFFWCYVIYSGILAMLDSWPLKDDMVSYWCLFWHLLTTVLWVSLSLFSLFEFIQWFYNGKNLYLKKKTILVNNGSMFLKFRTLGWALWK